MIRGPKNKYNFKEKEKYRQKVWSTFANFLDVETAVVLFLPSKMGYEIPIALSYGFKEENLIAVDDCPAVIATSKWRKEYPKIKFYGNTLSRAAERIKEDGIVIDAANLDLCGNISMPMVDAIQGFVFSGCLSGEVMISLTMLSGRESQAINTLAELYMKSINSNLSKFSKFSKRIQVMCSLIQKSNEFNVKYEYEGSYLSGKLKMVYGIWSMIHKEQIIFEMEQVLDILAPEIKNYCKLKQEHRDFRSFWNNFDRMNNTMYIQSLINKEVKISKKKRTEAQETNDIYCVWLDKEKKRLDKLIEKAILYKLFKYGMSYYRGFDSLRYYAMCHLYNDRLWKIFYGFGCGGGFYDGCQGRKSLNWCLNPKKAERYLNKIDWKIER